MVHVTEMLRMAFLSLLPKQKYYSRTDTDSTRSSCKQPKPIKGITLQMALKLRAFGSMFWLRYPSKKKHFETQKHIPSVRIDCLSIISRGICYGLKNSKFGLMDGQTAKNWVIGCHSLFSDRSNQSSCIPFPYWNHKTLFFL